MRIAVIDLGTNTFNLLIVDSDKNGTYSILVNEKLPVKLGAGGIGKRIITPEAVERGIAALKEQKKTIDNYHTDHIHAFATSAIRSADNGKEFADRIKKEVGINLEIITGEKEAELIFKGISQSVPLDAEKILVLDIGGGGEGVIGRLKGRDAVAVDIRKEELEEAVDGPLKIIMDARDLKFLDESFHTATAFFSMMYIRYLLKKQG
jgi:exopolyphosphatase/guanosine-5'-triphosphate,3'-diphosphate pyrophosphatase